MGDHPGYELVVDDVTQHVGIVLDEVLKHLQVRLALREAAAVLNGHGLPDDELRDLRVGSINALVIDIVGISACGFDELQFRVKRHDGRLRGTCLDEHTVEPVYLLAVARGRLGNAHRHSEDLAEGVPESEHVLLGNGVLRSLEIQAEIVRLSCLYEPV